jgi:hypothetical protein
MLITEGLIKSDFFVRVVVSLEKLWGYMVCDHDGSSNKERSGVSNRVTFFESMVRLAIFFDAGFRREDSLLTDRALFSQTLGKLQKVSARFSGLLLCKAMDTSQPPYESFTLNRDDFTLWKQRR